MTAVSLDALDLAALLCSRVCHDVISPVGAIVNGLEVLEDEDDISMKEFALDLIKKSARQASARLQFSRLAFGAAGSAGAEIDLGDAEQVAKGFIHDDKLSLQWNAERRLLPKNKVKLLLNLILVATNAIPRGGRITVDVDFGTSVAETRIVVSAQGRRRAFPSMLRNWLPGAPPRARWTHTAFRRFIPGRWLARPGLMSISPSTETSSRSRLIR